MQLMSGSLYLKLGGALAIAGAMAAAGASFRIPRRYEATAVIRLMPQTDAGRPIPKDAIDRDLASRFDGMWRQVLSRGRLSELIQRPSMNLYPEERRRMPMEEVVRRMRQRDLRLQRVDAAVPTVAIFFDYPDPKKSQAVAREVAAKFAEENQMVSRWRSDVSRRFWGKAPPVDGKAEILDAANLAAKPVGPNRLVWIACGLGSGLLMGLLTAFVMRRPKWGFQVAGFALAGCAVAAAVSWWVPDRYRSAVVMRFTQSTDPRVVSGAVAGRNVRSWVQQAAEKVLSQANLEEIARKRALNRYGNDPGRMRRDIDIRVLNSGIEPDTTFQIAFTYPDKLKAPAVVRELMSRFMEENWAYEEERAKVEGAEYRRAIEHRVLENLEILDPPSATPIGPNRLAWSGVGLAAGLMAGIVAAGLRVGRPISAPDRSPSAPAA